jgi:hypothetical protein
MMGNANSKTTVSHPPVPSHSTLPFENLRVLSIVEGLMALSKIEGLVAGLPLVARGAEGTERKPFAQEQLGVQTPVE